MKLISYSFIVLLVLKTFLELIVIKHSMFKIIEAPILLMVVAINIVLLVFANREQNKKLARFLFFVVFPAIGCYLSENYLIAFSIYFFTIAFSIIAINILKVDGVVSKLQNYK